MATTIQEGDRVLIADRPATDDDIKSQLFYDYFRGVTGVVQKLFTNNEAAVKVDVESLAEPVANRHEEVRDQMRAKWLDGLSEEQRGRLSDTDREFKLSYVLLVSLADVSPADQPAIAHRAPPVSAPLPPAQTQSTFPAEPPKRVTTGDIDAAEEEYLSTRRRDVS